MFLLPYDDNVSNVLIIGVALRPVGEKHLQGPILNARIQHI